MDTKSKKFKSKTSIKILCCVLSVILFFSGIAGAFTFLTASYIFDFENYITGNILEFEKSWYFGNKLQGDIYEICNTAYAYTEADKAEIEEKTTYIVNAATKEYLEKKAEIIRQELVYAINEYDDSYYQYEYVTGLFDDINNDNKQEPETEPVSAAVSAPVQSTNTDVPKQIYCVSDDAPANVKLAANVLNKFSGTQLLPYSMLVRDSAFDENNFIYDGLIYLKSGRTYETVLQLENFRDEENTAKSKLLLSFKNNFDSDIRYNADYTNASKSAIKDIESVQYYIKMSDGSFYTNMTETPDRDKILKYQTKLIYDKNEEPVITGIYENDSDMQGNTIAWCANSGAESIYIYYDNCDYPSDDIYGRMRMVYDTFQPPSAWLVALVTILSFISSIILLVFFISLCGRNKDNERPETIFTDKLPVDIHFIITGGLVATLITFAILLVENFNLNNLSYEEIRKYIIGISAVGSVCWLLLTEFISSIARHIKAGKPIFKDMITVRLWKTVIVTPAKKVIKAFSYKPEHFKSTVIVLIGAALAANIIIAVVAVLGLFPILILIPILDTAIAVFILNYMRNLDKIITASANHTAPDMNTEKLPATLKTLSESLTHFNDELNVAVAKAVRDEQMKTELITNVSHDLKTPLTSLISYSDLLGKCDIEDETANKYISVINDQSIKLKRLIEDLIEASKVSTGNINLNKTQLNLYELAVQAVVEITPEIEKNNNEIIFNEPEDFPLIFADSSKTYRIISNLLSNAKKYSAPYTRVYISVFTDGGFGCFEIKNISCEPLNISPEELTERFVRGDKSRSKEGNGLGLSIAKDLCVLQNGNLDISIDGDLFKVRVSLPLSE